MERFYELTIKTIQQLYEVATPCIDDQLKEEEMGFVREWSKVCSQIFLTCSCVARIDKDLIFYGSVNKLARAIKKWTRAFDKRLARLISNIHHTCECRQCCHVGNTAQQYTLGLFQDSDFAGDLENSESTSGGLLCKFVSHTFMLTSWIRKKQTSVSHSSTGAELFFSMQISAWVKFQLLICRI